MFKKRLPILIFATLLAGCATKKPPQPKAVASIAPVSKATRPYDPKSNLTLEQIEPITALPTPATQPSDKPSLEAIALYARARDELLQNRRFTAINYLEKAIAVDPTSPELRQALGRAYLGSSQFNDASIAALEKSVALQPDDLDVQLQLGRQYLAKGDEPKAISALRRAMLTTDYKKGDDQAALTDFFLATALQREGYDRAAIDRYVVLLNRIRSPGPALRGNPELNYLISRPESVFMEMGGLYEKSGRYEQALKAFETAADHDPDNYELHERIVRVLTQLRRPDAKDRAAELVKDFDARPDSITLLRDTYRAFNNEAGAADVLRKMLAEKPNDRLLLYALTTMLQQMGRTSEARDLLAGAMRSNRYPVEMVRRLQRLYETDQDWSKQALLLVEVSSERPDLVSRLAPLWSRLMRSTAKPRVRLNDIKQLEVPPQHQAAKLFWISTLAEASNRDGLAKSAMQQALAITPLYAPAYRAALNDAMQDGDTSPGVNSLLDRAASTPVLAAELRGIVLLQQKKHAEAEAAFRRAIELGGKSPDLDDELVDAVLRQNQDDKAEQLLLGIVNNWPDYEPGYLQLIGFYAGRSKDNQTVKTIETWLSNDPSSTTARLLQARFLLETRRPDAAELLINQLLAEYADNSEVLASIQSLYAMQGRLDVLAGKLSELYAKQPENRDLLSALVDVQLAAHKTNDATRLVDAARITFAADADGLYTVSNLYQRLDQKDAAEAVLEAALKVDPKHPSASNDLGYNWVDSGKNLDRAETLVRNAVAAEPDNQAFLDSLGWVLYKRSQFPEAVKYLQQASEGTRPDPVVLDHLGDALYRVNRRDDAKAEWTRAGERLQKLDQSRSDLKQLKLQLNAKLKQVKEGTPVLVAPVIESSVHREQAKSN